MLSDDDLVKDIVAHVRAVDLAIVGLGDPDRVDADPPRRGDPGLRPPGHDAVDGSSTGT